MRAASTDAGRRFEDDLAPAPAPALPPPSPSSTAPAARATPPADHAPPAAGTGRGLLSRATEMLTDPKGFLDRQRAARELTGGDAPLFQVVGDDHQGPRAANHLTQAELDEVVRVYSDIRLGRGDLTIDTAEMKPDDAAEYREGVMGNIAMLMQTESGRRQISGLHDNVLRDDQGRAFDEDGELAAPGSEAHRRVTLNAYYGLEHDGWGDLSPVQRDNNAASLPANQAESGPKKYREGGKQGLGEDAIVRFNPTVDIPGQRSDVILAHELEHARHTTQGIMEPGVVRKTHTAADVEADLPHVIFDDEQSPIGASEVKRSEHQAMGIGAEPMYPRRGGNLEGMTEAAYIRERNLLGDHGVSMRGSYRDPTRAPHKTRDLTPREKAKIEAVMARRQEPEAPEVTIS